MKSPAISVVLATRSNTTEFGGIFFILNEFRKTLHDPSQLEVVIRGDYDDDGFDEVIQKIGQNKYPFSTYFLKGNRGRGYEDLHSFFNECLLLTSPHKKIIFSLPEDVSITLKDWDKLLLQEYEAIVTNLGHRVFTMHQTFLPGFCDNFDDAIETPDPFPIYTSDWMHCLGGFGPTYANDQWVQAIHHYLLKDFGLLARHTLSQSIFKRNVDNQDFMVHERWVNARLRNHDFLRSNRMKNILERQAESLYLLISDQLNTALKNMPDMHDAINIACDTYGSTSILYKVFYNLINNATPAFAEELRLSIENVEKYILPNKNKPSLMIAARAEAKK